MTTPLLEMDGLSKGFPVRQGVWGKSQGTVHAVHKVSLSVARGETLGLVGESGCGKSTLGRLALRLLDPSAGRIRFEGQDITRWSMRRMRPLRQHLQVIFQNPYACLNPRMTVGEAIGEGMRIHGLVRGAAEERQRVAELLDSVGLRPEHAGRYPHTFSGGQRQRVSIARALAVKPHCIIADEPISALDVSVQAQIVNLLMELQRRQGIAYLFIAHDLRIVEHCSDRVAVMYLGRVVELGPAAAMFATPRHPYTQALTAATPELSAAGPRQLTVVRGEVPNPASPPPGCVFHPRCPLAEPGLCDVEVPKLRQLNDDHQVACHLA